MQLKFISILVSDQQRALDFYVNVLGFEKMADIPMGEYRWLTVVSPDGLEGVELVLEPIAFEPAKVYQKALHDAGIPATAVISRDIDVEYKMLLSRKVRFLSEPTSYGMIKTALFDDTCGNLINLVQPTASS